MSENQPGSAADADQQPGDDRHSHRQGHAHDHEGHSHGHDDHSHDRGGVIDAGPDDPEARARAIQSLLIEKGLVTTEAIDEAVTSYEEEIGPMYGAEVVARAWADDAYRKRLLADGKSAVEEFDFDHGIDDLRFVANTSDVHNVVVCTLCSCYPWSVLGLPPTWYKSEAYRSRVVREPRAVLAEFGLELEDDIDVQVWDSTSDLRYAVLPRQPPGTDDLSEADLADLVTRNSMVGVERVQAP